MPRFPYGPGPVPRQIQYSRRGAQRGEPQASQHIPGEMDLLNRASFSPELSFLLAMTLKDGLRQGSIKDLLRSIEPYVSGGDREAIHKILSAQKMADEYRKNPPSAPYGFPGSGLNEFSRLSRQQALLEILQHYASSESLSIMRSLQRSAQMQENFERMLKRIEKLRHMKTSSPDDLVEAMSLFMPPQEQSRIRNMQNMIRMMGGMKDFKPEDIFRFMNSGR